MLSGINTDIQFKGEVYHVQTEDGGTNNPIITTLLFKGGGDLFIQKNELCRNPSISFLSRSGQRAHEGAAQKHGPRFDCRQISDTGPKRVPRRSHGARRKSAVSGARFAAKGKPKEKLG
ncbi:MAG: hypothetical protein MPW14_01900 [Candidatus Manganitrophus sp.]|nr:MAG: hypothetical protein MPW14_01900 [Candidatus Manganitrophus sp.]